MKVSIIIATYNHLDDCLKPCCESLQKFVNFNDCEVIIAANGCTDGTREYVESLGSNFKLLWFEKPGFAIPVNEASKIAKGEYLLFLNNDCFFLKDNVIELLLAEFEKNPKVGIVGPESCYNEYGDTNYIKFYCTMMKKDVFNKLGMFDALFADGTCEDVDICLKALAAGYEIIDVTLPIFHKFGMTIREMPNVSSILTRNALNLGQRYNSKWFQAISKKLKEQMTVSIVIATYNHLEDCLKPCVESIKKYCNLENKEVIIVANGCKDGTREYVESLGKPFKLIWFDEATGAAKAYNEGIKAAKYQNILILNNDVTFLEQNQDALINMHLIHFRDPRVGIVGPIKSFNPDIGRDFIIFFCAMIRKEVFDKIGYLDEGFTVGGGEDIDFCIRAKEVGYECAIAGQMTGQDHVEGQITGSVPIFHKGETTVHDKSLVSDWGGRLQENYNKLVEKHRRKVSIVIGTLNHLDDLLKPCLESIIKYVDLSDKEVIVVANGCTDGTREYVESLGGRFRLLWFNEPLGFPKAYNEGIKVAKGDYILLLNNDAMLLEQEKDTLINMHIEQFDNNPKVGIAGPLKSLSPCVNKEFIIFFCAMIKREVFEKIGLLDEAFKEGAGEDTDFCIRAEERGYEIAVVGKMTGQDDASSSVIGSVPIYHKGEGTLHDDPNHQANIDRNTKLLVEKYKNRKVLGSDVLCMIPTKGRYFTTLPLAIQSVILQTVKPAKLTIYDDGEHKDMRQNPTYQYLFKSLDDVGIKWEVAFTPEVGQHFAHQNANTSGFKFVWRLDDDTVARPDVLEKLLSHMKDGVGAVGGSVITPGGEALAQHYATHILDIMALPNLQWAKGEGVFDVNQLYSSFLYRTNIVDYCLELSKVAHREETIFTHRLFRAGYRLLVDRSAVTYHYRNPEGGIRTETDAKLWEGDEEIFRAELKKWGYKFIALSHGLGDHLMFVNLLPELLKRCQTLVLFCVYGEVFQGLPNIICKPLGEAAAWGCKETGIYEWMVKYNWKRSMLEAYEKLYLD